MKNILLIGVGGCGSDAVDIFFQKYHEIGNQTENKISAIVFDTDKGDIESISSATPVPMADPASVGTICDRLGGKLLREWFPCDDKAVRAQEMVRGASQWRKKSYLAFLNLMNKPEMKSRFISSLEKMTIDPSASCEVYVITSVAGGTGSGSFIPIALFAKQYLRERLGIDPIVNAMIALPDIFASTQTPDNKIKIFANAYAILRELNAINCVARGYNEGHSEKKKSPIRIRIGHPEDTNVGVLFDSMDKRFWTPESAPFTQVFMLDHIPGLNSPQAHKIVMANSLYTILCTDIGNKFDSEASNHETLRSQSNGSNAIYAGVSTSQIRFPVDTVLDYLAHKKTINSCDAEWLVLHNLAESKIKEREIQAKACGRRYTMGKGEYAKIILEAFENMENSENHAIVDLVDRGTANIDKEGKKAKNNKADDYFEKLKDYIGKIIPDSNTVKNTIKGSKPNKKATADDVISLANKLYNELLDYFAECVDAIKRNSTSIVDSIISFDKKKDTITNKELSIEDNLVKTNGKYIHPVAAMVQLCRLRSKLADAIGGWDDDNKWKSIKAREIDEIDSSLLAIDEDTDMVVKGKSAYLALESDRFLVGTSKKEDYREKKSNYFKDSEYVISDAEAICNKIYGGATEQLELAIYLRLADQVDLLIDKYRTFFARFDKEKEDLIDETKIIRVKDNGTVDSAINVLSTASDKEKDDESTPSSKDYLLKTILEEAGPESTTELIKTDNVIGAGVFKATMRAAVASYNRDASYNDKDSSTFRSLFSGMVDAYKEFFKSNDAFTKISSYNIIQAIEAECGDNAAEDVLSKRFHEIFSNASQLATPSLAINGSDDLGDLVKPSKQIVFMLSEDTCKYIKKRADIYRLKIPTDQTGENQVIKSCAEEFIHKYSGIDNARVSIVRKSMPDQIMYCTGEIMDIVPLRISKFDECSDSPDAYFPYYKTAISNAKKYKTDMWNPHLGFNYQKRGNLPYMNEKMEEKYDMMMIKALLYGFLQKIITYECGRGKTLKQYAFRCNGERIRTADGVIIGEKNIAKLVGWIRNEDTLVDEWSRAFDYQISKQKNDLFNIISDNEFGQLETSITQAPFMKALTGSLYTYRNEKGAKVSGPSIIEFAHLVRTNEELDLDCDDAERILNVAYSTFYDLCAFRANPDNYADRFIQIYQHELDKVFESVVTSKFMRKAEGSYETYFTSFCSWLYDAGVFRDLEEGKEMDDTGKLVIEGRYNINGRQSEARKKFNENKEKANRGEKLLTAKEEAEEVKEETDSDNTDSNNTASDEAQN